MGQRGRKPASELAITGHAQIEAVVRPAAPYDLTDEEAEEWSAVVNAMPADWFPPETHASLANRCRHVVRARRIALLIDDHLKGGVEGGDQKEWDDRLDRLMKMAERESRAINALERSLRMTLQSTYDKTKKKASAVKRPWEE